MKYYLIAVLAFVSFGFQTLFTKMFQNSVKSNLTSSLVFSAYSSLLVCAVFIVINKFSLEYTPFSLLTSAAIAVFSVLCNIAVIKLVSIGNISLYTLFVMMGALIMPFIFGIAVLKEEVTAFKIIGVVIMVAALFMSLADSLRKKGESEITQDGKGAKRGGMLLILLCAAVFLMNGGVNVFSKVEAVGESFFGRDTVGIYDYLIWSRLFTVVVSVLIFPFVFLKKGEKRAEELGVFRCFAKPKPLIFGALFAAANIMGFALQLYCASYISASVLYPLVTGGTIIVASVLGRIFYKQKISPLMAASLALTAVSAAMFVF